MAIIAVIVSFSVAGAWFMDRDKTDSEMPMGSAVIVKLVGTGEDGAIQNFKELYNSDGGAYPGDKILDSIKVQMGENTEESVLRVQYSVDILDKEKNVKTQDLTEAETKLATLLKNDLRTKTTLFSSDWSQTTSDWIYYKHLASGKTKPIDLFDEYSLPLPDAQMDNSYQELSFRISLVAEAIQAANIMSFDEWNNDITNLSDSALIERVIKYNGERFADVDEVLPYIEFAGGQYIDTGAIPNTNTKTQSMFYSSTFTKWLFGSRTDSSASNIYGAYLNGETSFWYQVRTNGSANSVENYANKKSTLTTVRDGYTLNDKTYSGYGTSELDASTWTMYIGAMNTGGSPDSRYFVGKIYSFKIWDNGQLVRFFVPARDKEGNVGFYDLVTKEMYLNEGSGSFAYGHSINYIANGGTIDASAPKTFVSSDLPITLPTPTRTGYEFGGWFLSADFSGAAQTTIPAGTDNNVYLYAKWIKTYKITYHLGGGENAESNPQTFNEKTLPLTLAAPTREGFTFGGWYQNPAYSGSQVTTIEVGTEKNVSLWAKWDAIEYSITYILNGGTNSDQNVTKFTILDTPVKLFNPTYEGYVFEGWFASSDFSGERKTYLSKDNLGDITLYAKWSLAYTITYNTNGGLNDGRNPSVFTESTETFTLYGATKVNFTFLGWFDNEELSGTPITQITKGTKKNIVLWAKWSSTQITVTFDPNGGGVSPVTKVVKKGGTYVELPIPTKAGYTFNGWFTEVDGGTQVLPTSTVISDADHTLFAHWTENVYTVTYNLDGGTNAAGNPATFKRSNLPIALLDATKDGEYFAGWYLDAEFTKRVTKIDAGSLKNIELWARFSQSPLVFDLVGTSAYSVRAANATISGDIEIPATYNGKPVVVIQNYGFKDCANLTSIAIPSSVKSIGINAFENCSSIAEIVIPEGVTLVANNTFLGCVKLASMTLPATLENIGAKAFFGCASLTTIALPKNIEEIGANAFANCSTLATIEVFGDTPATLKTGVFPSNVSKIYVKPSLVSTYKTAWPEYKDKIVGFLEYTIIYNLDGGTNNDRNITSFTQIDLPIKLYAPTKENADFLGWYETSDFSGESITEITTAANVTLYARWDRKMTITYVLNGGKNNASNLSTITESMLPYSLMPANWVNHAFIGWFLDENLTEEITSISQFGNITIYAAWQELNPYLVFTLNSEGTEYSVKASSTDISGVINIPSVYGGKPVTAIEENAFAKCSKMTDLFIPSSVTSIGSSAFNNCSSDLLIYSEVTSQPSGWSYSANIYGVKGMPISNDEWKFVEKLDGTLIMIKCLNNTMSVEIPSDINGKAVIEIYSNCFKGKDKISSITISSSITSINENAFSGCTAMKRIFIPKNVTIIGSNIVSGWKKRAVIYCEVESKPSGWASYWNCTSGSYSQLTTIWGVTNMPQNNLEWEYIENSNDMITILAYWGNAKDVTIPASFSNKAVSEISDNCFSAYTSMTSISIPESVVSIGRYAFSECTGLTSIILPNNVMTLGEYAFSDCTELISVTLSSKLEKIQNDTFNWCKALKSIVIPAGVTSIGQRAFYNCNSMTQIYIPISVLIIDSDSNNFSPFYNWNSSAVIYCGAASKPSGWGTYWNCYSSSSTLTTIWNVAGLPQQNSEWEYIEKNDGTIRLEKYVGFAKNVSVPANISNKTVNEMYQNCCKDNTSIDSIIIPDSVTDIGNGAFSGCTALTRVTLSNNLSKIATETFYNCEALTSITIPNSVTSIERYAFYGCNALESMTIPFVGRSATSTSYEGVFGYIFGYTTQTQQSGYSSSSSSFTTSITGSVANAVCSWSDTTHSYRVKTGGTKLFPKYTTYYGVCSYWYYIPSSLKNITVTGGSINTAAFCRVPNINVTLDGVDVISTYAFYGSKITSITIPNSVTTIAASSSDNSPFYGWDSSAIIYCEASSRPSGWGTYWNYYNSANTLKTYYQTTDCIHEDGVWAYDSNGEIKTFNDISWVVDVEATFEMEGSKHGICPICGATVTGVIPKKDKFTISNDSSYPWIITNNFAAVSTNKAYNTSSTLTLTFVHSGKIRIKYKTSSDVYNRLTINHNSTTIGTYSGTSQSTFSTLDDITFSLGDTIKFTYRKNNTMSTGSDCAWVEWEIVE